MEKNVDLRNAPKQFLDNANGGFTEDHFIVAMFTGANGTVYALTPQHMKRLSQWMTYQVAEFEKKYHEIHAEWVPGTKSPLQSTDLNEDRKD